MTAAVIQLATETPGSEHGVDLPAEPWVIGLTVFALLVALLLITLTWGKDR
jgi:hypothetical protein